MPAPPERILVFRSGRHLQAAIATLRAQSPSCDITVVATAGAMAALDEAGIPPSRRLVYVRTPFFHPWSFVRSGVWLRAVTRGFDRVCVLWTDPDGVGHGNVDRTALIVSPRGFTAITPDGRLLTRRTGPLLIRESTRAAMSVCVVLILGLLLFLPARMLRSIGQGRGC